MILFSIVYILIIYVGYRVRKSLKCKDNLIFVIIIGFQALQVVNYFVIQYGGFCELEKEKKHGKYTFRDDEEFIDQQQEARLFGLFLNLGN